MALGYPTTLILLAVIGSVTGLGLNGTVDSASVTTILGGIVSGVLVGHYVKTTPTNGHTTTTTTTDAAGGTTTVTGGPTVEEKGTL